jgi:hydroxymethylglutaryl-CoA lyase
MTMRVPSVHRRAGLPESVRIYEVGPRDGLQNEAARVPTEVKAEFIARLGDAEQLMPLLAHRDTVRYPVLVPNMAGLERAQAAGATHIAVFAAATETFSRRNLNRSLDEALAMFAPVVAAARRDSMWVRSYLSMCFGDPWEGDVPLRQVVDLAQRLLDQGSDELSIADTIGVATPGQVSDLLGALDGAGIRPGDHAVHFHDTYGQALANTVAALEAGVRTVDSSAGGLGGCPYAESATGNLATEDLVWMLHGLGVTTGVDLEKLVAASAWMAGQLGRPSPSRVVQALMERTPV